MKSVASVKRHVSNAKLGASTQGNPLEAEVTHYYQPDIGFSIAAPSRREFATAEVAKRYIATKVDVQARESHIKLACGATLHVTSRELNEGRFTNSYDLVVDPGQIRAHIAINNRLQSVGGYMRTYPRSVASASGGFLYLADVGSGVPRQMPLNLALQDDGTVLSIPTVDRECLVSDRAGKLAATVVPARGELTIDGHALSWAGSRTAHHADCIMFGNGNVRIEHEADPNPVARKDRIRVLDERSRYTPCIDAESNLVDIGLIAGPAGRLLPVGIFPSGHADLFQYDSVMRCEAKCVPRGLQSLIILRTIGPLVLDKGYQGAFSIGPLFSDNDLSSNGINFDPSLGSDPPFVENRLVRMVLYETVNEQLHIRLFDGRPGSEHFQGVTPQEALAIVREEADIAWGAFLDPGRTAKISAHHGRHITSYGNTHYLRWPTQTGTAYEWVPGAGRPVASAIILTPHLA